jgi:hypothetical protein
MRTGIAQMRAWMHRLAFERGLCRHPLARWTTYDVDWLYAALVGLGFSDTEYAVLFVRTEMFAGNGRHCFFLARKPKQHELTTVTLSK